MSNHRRVELFTANLFAITISFLITYFLRFGWEPDDIAFYNIRTTTIYIYLFLSYLIVFTFYHNNPEINKRGILRHAKSALLTNLFMAIIFSAIVYLTHTGNSIPRLFFGIFFSVNFIVSFITLYLIHFLKREYLEHHTKKTVVFTDRANLRRIIRKINNLDAEDCEIIGISPISGKSKDHFFKLKPLAKSQINSESTTSPAEAYDLKELTTPAIEYIKCHNVDFVIFSVMHTDREKIRELIELVSKMGIDSLITIDSFAIETLETKLEDFGTSSVIRLSPRIFTDGELIIKRLMDILGALVGCLICILFGIIVAPLIYLEDPGPIIFKQKRVGRNGKFFYIYKFRSMYQNAEERLKDLQEQNEMQGFMFKMKNDPRITKIGKILRKTSIDELPQFFNVLGGSMSLVGTRPPTVNEYNQYAAHHKRRISIKPGITGLWQVSGRSEITDFEKIVRLDCYYIDHWSITYDIKILIKTVAAVFTGKGSE